MHPVALRYPVTLGYRGEDGLRWGKSAGWGGGDEGTGIGFCRAGSGRDGVGRLEMFGDHNGGEFDCGAAVVGNRPICIRC